MTSTPSTPAGWYPDPGASGSERYWDGQSWSDSSRSAAAPSATPPSASPGAKPDSYLVWAIVSLVLCCWPLGIVAVVKATQVDRAWYAGDLAGARAASEAAKKWTIITAVAGAVIGVAWAALFLIGSMGASGV